MSRKEYGVLDSLRSERTALNGHNFRPQTPFPCSEGVPRALLREFVHIFPVPTQDDLDDPITREEGIPDPVWILLQGGDQKEPNTQSL